MVSRYDKVMKYKQSVIQKESLENIIAQYIPGTFTQWVADNIDHNVATLDGQGTFHGMGIIAVSTPKDNKPITKNAPMILRQQHTKAVGRMMNLFAATGHIHYAKSSRLYIQQMLDLPNYYPWLYQCFIEHGFHTVRRNSRYWAGLWTDLTIEQVMMQSIKSRGGLTRGRGLTESVRSVPGYMRL